MDYSKIIIHDNASGDNYQPEAGSKVKHAQRKPLSCCLLCEIWRKLRLCLRIRQEGVAEAGGKDLYTSLA